MQSQIFSIELDFHVDGEQKIPNILNEVAAWLQENRLPAAELWTRVVNVAGPAGGNPVVQFGHTDMAVLDKIILAYEGGYGPA